MFWFLVIAILGITYGMFEYHWLKITKLKSSDFNNAILPEDLVGKRIVFVSDFQFDHKRRWFMHRMARKVVDEINMAKPDLVLLGGDYIHQDHKGNVNIFNYLKEISAPKIGVLGNHDYRNIETVKVGLKTAGVHLLINETMDYCGLTIVGVDDYKEGAPVLPESQTQPTLLLNHNPDYFETINQKFDFALSGHLHAGQITSFGLFAPISNSENGQKLLYGLKKRPNGTLYVTSGVGGSVGPLPVRFFARPEIVIIDF